MLTIDLFEEMAVNDLTLIDALRDFLPLAIKHLELPGIPKITLEKSIEKSNVPTFGRFTNDDDHVYVAVNNRNPNDIIRTLAHELVHFKQRTEHELAGGSWHTGSPAENQAHEVAGIIMREFNSKFPQYLRMKPVVLSDGSSKHIDEANLPQSKQPKLKLQPLIKGLAYQWFLIYYGLHHATEPEIVNDRAGYAAELDKVAKKLGQLGFAIQYVPDLPDLGDGGGGEGVYITHIASKQTAAIDHYDLDQDYEKFLPLAFKALNGSVSETKQRLDPKCWKGKHKEGTKIKGGVRVNNCVPNESQVNEKWSKKYKDSINCSNPKGFSQKAHCAGKKK